MEPRDWGMLIWTPSKCECSRRETDVPHDVTKLARTVAPTLLRQAGDVAGFHLNQWIFIASGLKGILDIGIAVIIACGAMFHKHHCPFHVTSAARTCNIATLATAQVK